MKEPKVYVGSEIDIKQEYDIFIFLPPSFTGDKQSLMEKAKFKYIELSDRKRFADNPMPVLKKTQGIKEGSQNIIKQKRKRIGE